MLKKQKLFIFYLQNNLYNQQSDRLIINGRISKIKINLLAQFDYKAHEIEAPGSNFLPLNTLSLALKNIKPVFKNIATNKGS